jgi:3-dehydroquinate synthase
VGFAASIYKRGIAYVNIPTTLLGMIDAGVGGKTGVNLDSYKNMLGSFKLPEFIWLYPEVLRSLPHREFLSGAAEMLKTFIISDRNGSYARAVRLFSKYASDGVSPVENADGLKELSALIQEASEIKQDIVEKDPFEKRDRSKLNLGHTWAHAIEWWKPGAYTHGEAVAIGIIQAARKAEELALTQKGAAGKHGLTQKGLADRLKEDFTACGLPTELPCAESELLPAMRRDKKANGGSIRFVLPVSIGKVIVKSIPL